jgi:fatty acid desaturase/peptidoglycan/LPS O-acetylase OafA/YrhL
MAIGVHLLVVLLATWQLAARHATPLYYACWATLSGVSLFVLTGLVHEASHRLLSRVTVLNELLGNLAGWMVLTPLSAYRAFHLKHHQRTNREDDPNGPLNSRWMLGIGSLVYASLIHYHAWRRLRGRLLARYLVEMAGMAVFVAALVLFLPGSLRDRAWLLPLVVVMILQNIRIVTEHLDLPAGRYQDTWQLVLPGWLSGWLLHYDHHLEHHLRPGLHWYELPGYRAGLDACEPGLGLHRVTLGAYLRDVVFTRRSEPARESRRDSPAAGRTFDGRTDGDDQAHRVRIRADAPAATPADRRPALPRNHGLDAMRGVTMALVVVLHAALAYAVVPIPNLIWAVHDSGAKPAFDLLCWWTLGISSPFYLISGFFAVALCESRGLRAFFVNRVQRIVGPFVVAGVTLLPATFFIWVFGWLISGRCTMREIIRMKFHSRGYQENLYGPAHLWSLEYLAIMLAAFSIVVGLRGLLVRHRETQSRLGRWVDRMLASPWRPLYLAVPSTLILWVGHRVVGLDAMMDRLNSFVPEPYRLLHNAVFFVVGVRLHGLRQHLGAFAPHGWTYLALSVPVFACRAVLIHWDLERSLDGAAAVALAVSGGLFCWLITFGFLGLALGVLNRPQPALSYLADSSYWVYLTHLPIVGLLQVDLHPVAAPAALKFLIVLSGTMALTLASYQVIVRYTFVGLWLHGRRIRTEAVLAMNAIRHRNYVRLSRRWKLPIVGTILACCCHSPLGCAPDHNEAEARAMTAVIQLDGATARDTDEKGAAVGKVDLTGKPVSDGDVNVLTGLAGLRNLVLRQTRITDAGLVALKSMRRLRELDLDETGVTDAGLVHLGTLTSLRGLYLAGTEVSDDGLSALSSLKKLRELGLRRTKVTDAGLRQVGALAELRVLDLRETRVTCSGLSSLAGLSRLQKLYVSGTQISTAGAQELERALPNVKIVR